MTGLAIGEFANAHVLSQQARKLARGAAETLAVSDRSRADDAVRKHSVDIDDERARIVKPLGDGTVEDAADCRDALLMAVEEHARQTSLATKHKHGDITAAQLAVFKVMLTDDEGYDISSGTVDLAISQYQEKSGKCSGTVQKAKKRLKALGVIELVNRTVHSGRAKLFGVPQRLQIATLIYFTPEKMIAPLKALYDRFLVRLRMARAQRDARRTAKGEDVQRRPLERRERRQKRVPAMMNPAGWRRILAAERKAQGERDATYAAREAEALAFTTALAASLSSTRDVTLE